MLLDLETKGATSFKSEGQQSLELKETKKYDVSFGDYNKNLEKEDEQDQDMY